MVSYDWIGEVHCSKGDEDGDQLVLAEEEYVWTCYTNGARTSFISNADNKAMDVMADFSAPREL